MSREPRWRRYLRFWGPDPRNDIDDELQFHIQTKIDELIAGGMTPRDARREALRQFGPLGAVRDECCSISKARLQTASRTEYLRGWLRDVQYAIRVLMKAKASTAIAVLLLALGIGANTALFTFLDRLLYAPLLVPQPSRLALISLSSIDNDGQRKTGKDFSYPEYLHLRSGSRTFSAFAAESRIPAVEGRPRENLEGRAIATPVSGNFFEALGVRPVLGRVLTAADDTPSAASHVAVVSDRFWKRRFSRAPDVLGRPVYLEGMPFTIVGVLPAGFYGTQKGYDPDLYIPLNSAPHVLAFGPCLRLIGRLRPGVQMATAEANVGVLWGSYIAGAKEVSKFRAWRYQKSRIQCERGTRGYAGTSGENRRSLFLLAGIAALLFVMASINVVCLTAARGAARRQEIAVRLSLGAGRARILRQLLLESLLIAVAGGAAGMLVSLWADRLILLAFRWQDRPIELAPDSRVVIFSLALSIAAGVLIGLLPALQALRSGRVTLNRERSAAPRFNSGKALVIVEVALSLVLVAGAAVFLRSFQNLRSVPTGFSPEHVSVITLERANAQSLDPPLAEALVLVDSLRGTPNIESTAVADLLTFDDSRILYTLAASEAPQEKRNTNLLRVDGGYFDTLGVRLIAGRKFTRLDDERAPKVAILAESTARRLFPNRNPLGRRILVGPTDLEVVGIVNDVKFTSVAAPAPDVVFHPLLQDLKHGAFSSTAKLQIRSRLAPEDVAAIVRNRIRDQHLPIRVESVRALEDAIASSMWTDRLRMRASSLFGSLALLLIAAGIYGLMAYSVARRTREIGVRIAIGAKPSAVVRLILKESSRLVLLGVLIGLPGAIALMKAVSGMLFGLTPVDPASLIAAALLLTLTGLAAALAPALRAAHLDPVEALRLE